MSSWLGLAIWRNWRPKFTSWHRTTNNELVGRKAANRWCHWFFKPSVWLGNWSAWIQWCHGKSGCSQQHYYWFAYAQNRDGKSCKIHGGLDETFRIVRQNNHLVVICARTGCMFTGDFPHAGVRNICQNTPEDLLMEKFNCNIADIINEYPAREHIMRTKAVVDMMCKFPGLDRLCRLHCSTEMLEGNIRIPPNTIGFSECLPNMPDTKCHEHDMPLQINEEKPTSKNVAGAGGWNKSKTERRCVLTILIHYYLFLSKWTHLLCNKQTLLYLMYTHMIYHETNENPI